MKTNHPRITRITTKVLCGFVLFVEFFLPMQLYSQAADTLRIGKNTSHIKIYSNATRDTLFAKDKNGVTGALWPAPTGSGLGDVLASDSLTWLETKGHTSLLSLGYLKNADSLRLKLYADGVAAPKMDSTRVNILRGLDSVRAIARENALRDSLRDVAAHAGSSLDTNIVQNLKLDTLKTYASPQKVLEVSPSFAGKEDATHYSTFRTALAAATNNTKIVLSGIDTVNGKITVSNVDSLTINAYGALRQFSTSVGGTTMFLEFQDCDNLTILGLKIDGKSSSRSGTYGAGSLTTLNGITIRAVSQDSVRNIVLRDVDVRRVFGDGIVVNNADNVMIDRCVVDSCAEGILLWSGSNGWIQNCTVLQIMDQDGIEPSNWNNVWITNNTFPTGIWYNGNTAIDVFASSHVDVMGNKIKPSKTVTYSSMDAFSTPLESTPNSNFIKFLYNESGPVFFDSSITNLEFAFNTIIDSSGNGGTGLVVNCDSVWNDFKWVHHNTVYAQSGMLVTGHGDRLRIENNEYRAITPGFGVGLTISNLPGTYQIKNFSVRNNSFYDFNTGIYLYLTDVPSIDTASIVGNHFYNITLNKIGNAFNTDLSAIDKYGNDGATNDVFTNTITDTLTTEQINLVDLNTPPSSVSDSGLINSVRFCADGIYVKVSPNTWKKVDIKQWLDYTTNLQLWLRSDNLSNNSLANLTKMETGDSVYFALDKSGNNRRFRYHNNLFPLYTADLQNGFGAIVENGTAGMYYDNCGGCGSTISDSSFNLFAVVQTTGDDATIFAESGGTLYGQYLVMGVSGENKLRFSDDVTLLTSGTLPYARTATTIIEIEKRDSIVVLRQNGLEVARDTMIPGAININGTEGVYGSKKPNGKYFEMRVYSPVPSQDEQSIIRAALFNRYAIGSYEVGVRNFAGDVYFGGVVGLVGVSTGQMNAISNPPDGALVYNNDSLFCMVKTAAGWKSAGGGSGGGGGGGTIVDGQSLGGGQPIYAGVDGVHLQINTLNSDDHELSSNVLSIKPSKWATLAAGRSLIHDSLSATTVNGHALQGAVVVTPADVHLPDTSLMLKGLIDGKQTLDPDLTAISGLTATTDNFIVSVASAWASRTPAEVKTTLSLQNVTNESKATMFSSPAFTGTPTGITATHVSLGNVTNESKATMFTSPTFTGTPTFTLTSDATGDMFYRNSSGFFTRLGKGTQYQTLQGGSTIPTWAALSLGQATAITGTLPLGNGGTGQTSASAAFEALAPSKVGNANKVMRVNGTETAYELFVVSGTGTVTDMSIVTANGVSGTVATSTTTPAVTLTLGAITPSTIIPTGAVTLAAGTAGLVPLTIPASVVQSSIASGNITRNASSVFTAATSTTENGLLPSEQFAIVPAGDFALANASGVQTCFPATCDVWTLAASTAYFVQGHYFMTTAATTTKTTAIAFALGGGASVTLVGLHVMGWNGIVNSPVTTQGTVWMSQVASTVVTGTATTAGVQIWFQGIIQMNAGGTVTPQINFSANPGTGNAMKAGSYIMFTKLGTNTTSIQGSVN